MRNTELDSNIEKIYNATFETAGADEGGPPNFNETVAERGYIVLADANLTGMFPDRETDILINAHVPFFDRTPFPHQHTFFELTYVHSGGLHMTIAEKSHDFGEGDFVLVNPDVVHMVTLGTSDSRVINILLKRSLLNKSFMHVILNNPLFADFIFPSVEKGKHSKNHMIFRKALQNNPALITYLNSILREYTDAGEQILNESALEINLAGLCLELARCRSRQTNAASQAGKYGKEAVFSLTDVCRYLSDNLSSATLNETAAHFHYNPKYFSDLLKKTYGKSFSGLMADLKMAHAARLLQQTELPISEIILRLGYANTSHFYRLFEETYGMKPLEYRQAERSA
ncbi:MAG: AraC family transcriptional regulator [Lachnospiraceae bacterium]|nr:AraC family transcriptional regulator [Lachnospiraceae bacterium]